MKNLKAYKQASFKFHLAVIKSKKNSSKDPQYKTRVTSYSQRIKTQYDSYDICFKQNNLETLTCHTFNATEKSTLLKLYSYSQSIFKQLKVALTTDENNTISNVCQNCTIGEVNSFDHYAPKTEFPEFVVNPKNLIPSCTKCNGFKSTTWRNKNKKVFLNLYLDHLPVEQYLFVNIKVHTDVIDLKYEVKNDNGLNSDLFELIETHYSELELCQRFRENSDSVISELDIEIRKWKKKLSLNDIKETILEELEEHQLLYGYNYWKSILKKSLLNSSLFIKRYE
jgi:hypothetical protein